MIVAIEVVFRDLDAIARVDDAAAAASGARS